MRFNGSSGKRPSAEARRYIYSRLASILRTSLNDDTSWINEFDEFDRRRLRRAAKLVAEELRRKANK